MNKTFRMAEAIVGHLFGDYILQNDWIASGKKRSSWICALHCALWANVVTAFANWPWWAFIALFIGHFIQDRWSLVERSMDLSGQNKFRTGPLAPWSTIVVDNVWHLVTLLIISKLV